MPAIYLTEDDVRELLDVAQAIPLVETAFRSLAEGKASNVPRARAFAKGIALHAMSAAAEYLGYVGWKVYTTTRRGARFHVGLSEIASGELVALIEADYLGQVRTGSASGVATEYMARADARTVGLFGTGKQARTQLKAVCSVRRIERAEIYSRNAERREKFAAEMCEFCGTRVVAVHSPQEAVREKDIVICATTSEVPLFEGRDLDLGTHLNVVGSNYLNKAEIDVDTIRRSDIIVCDSIEACRREAGDFVAALEAGVTDWALMHDLGDVVADRQTGRAHPEQITLFKSVGLAIEDVAAAVHVYHRARAENIGKPCPF
ncbi:MAG TPA: ornithine cyclodeaminase family protein [Planctomycetaceae bacterium]|nr:ornithine cyclodeaminase family protein [Planctomycetaceae bacterium]